MRLLLFFCLLFGCQLFAQEQNPYFQQKVDIKIKVTLDDINHTLTGEITFIYYNHSPNSLNEIYFHAWPNAYKNKQSELAKQFYQQGNLDFLQHS